MEMAGGQGHLTCSTCAGKVGQKHVLIHRSGQVKDFTVYLGSSSAAMRSRLPGRED